MDDLFRHFGLRRGDPFLQGRRFEWTGMQRIHGQMRRAAENREWILVYARPGAGKTESLNEFVERYAERYHLAFVMSNDRENVRMNSLHSAIVQDLDLAGCLGERPAHAREQRARQLVRLLGVRCQEKPVLLVLDEASRFCSALFDDIKFLRDQLWGGRLDKRDRRAHFGVAMFGWKSLADRISSSAQNRIRVRRYEAPEMSQAEVSGFVEHCGLGRIVTGEACEALFKAKVRFPGEIVAVLREALERAAVRGRTQVLPCDLASDLGALAADLRSRGITFAAVAREAGVSAAVVTGVFGGTYRGRESTAGQAVQTARAMIEDFDDNEFARKPHRRLENRATA